MAKSSAMTKIVRPLRSGQITIPAQFREQLGIHADTLLQITIVDGELRMRPVQATNVAAGSPWLVELYELFAPVRQAILDQGLSKEEIDAAIDQAVAEVRSKHAHDRP